MTVCTRIRRCLALALGSLAASAGLCFAAERGSAIELPPGTAIPMQLTSSVSAAKMRPGDRVTAVTTQVILLPDGQRIPRKSLLVGHVVDARPFVFNHTPYAHQVPSELSLRFDSLVEPKGSIPLHAYVRALANSYAAGQVATPQGIDESDPVGTLVLIGGDHYSPAAAEVHSPDSEDVVGYNRRNGIFAHLLPATDVNRFSSVHCDGTTTEQSMGVFSADACGAYGFDSVYMENNGLGSDDGILRLLSPRETIELPKGAAGLLEVERGE